MSKPKNKFDFKIVKPTDKIKLLAWGEPKVGKTTFAMQFPDAVIMDLEGGSHQYQEAFGVPGLDIEEGNFEQLSHACSDAIKQGFKTIIIDQLSTLYEWHQDRWAKLFLQQEPRSKGNKKQYYTFQPADYVHVKRGWRLYIQGILRLKANIVAIARSKPLYAEGAMMQKIGETYDSEKGLAYEFDYIVNIQRRGDQRMCFLQQRCVDNNRKLPERFPLNDAIGHFNLLMGVSSPKIDAKQKEKVNA